MAKNQVEDLNLYSNLTTYYEGLAECPFLCRYALMPRSGIVRCCEVHGRLCLGTA